MRYVKFQGYIQAMQCLCSNRKLTKQDLLNRKFLIETDKNLSMYYAPHNDYINRHAKIVIVGITPGWQQMKVAYEQAVKSIQLGHNQEQVTKHAKVAASFTGSMRKNLITMLDQCGVPEKLHINRSATLFEENRSLLHTTSIIKYPTFYHEKNYTGYQPTIKQSTLLSTYVNEVFPEELCEMYEKVIVIPLGKVVEQTLKQLVNDKKIPDHTYLYGFPHPSGANGHRKKQFETNKEQLAKLLLGSDPI